MDDLNIREPESPTRTSSNRWLQIAVFILLAVAVGTSIYALQERSRAKQWVARYDQMSLSLDQTRRQVDALKAEVISLGAQTSAPAAAAPPQATVNPAPAPASKRQGSKVSRKAEKRAPAEDPRWKQVQAELAGQQKQIEATRQDVEKNRSDLEGRLSSARDELSTSIARTHEELVALQKKGERNYSEFDLRKSKHFSRTGPLSISLRKANTKRQYCDLELLVDDIQITKKHVNLYEPVLLYPADFAQPLEVVINIIQKNQARGYVSVPKYRLSESGAASSTSSATTSPPGPKATLEHRPELQR